MSISERVNISNLEGSDIKVARTFNWTGQVISGPWSQLDKILNYLGDERPGVIICDASSAEKPELAVHGTYDVAGEIREQEGKADWHQVFVTVPQQWELTKPQLKYIEQKLAETIYSSSDDSEPKASLFEQWPELSESQEADAEQFISYMRLLTKELGGTFFDAPSISENDDHEAPAPRI